VVRKIAIQAVMVSTVIAMARDPSFVRPRWPAAAVSVRP
jgi:hypothetical protein